MDRILVIASHMDDEVLGCGGTILKHYLKGDYIHVCFMTDSSTTQYKGDKEKLKAKYNQAREVQKILGINNLTFLDFPDMKLDQIPIADLASSLSKIVAEVKPSIIYTHSNSDLNSDHRRTHEATLVAARPNSGVKKIFAYEVLSSTEWGIGVFKPNLYIDITNLLLSKQKAMSCYGDEIRDYPNPRSLKAIDILAKKRGIESGLIDAEAFEIIRIIMEEK